jgi:hypothetical protein
VNTAFKRKSNTHHNTTQTNITHAKLISHAAVLLVRPFMHAFSTVRNLSCYALDKSMFFSISVSVNELPNACNHPADGLVRWALASEASWPQCNGSLAFKVIKQKTSKANKQHTCKQWFKLNSHVNISSYCISIDLCLLSVCLSICLSVSNTQTN